MSNGYRQFCGMQIQDMCGAPIQHRDIEKILGRKVVSGKVRYLVKWKQSYKSNTWEPSQRFSLVKQMVEDFENKELAQRSTEEKH